MSASTRVLPLVAVAALLASCTGSDSSSSPTTATAPLTSESTATTEATVSTTTEARPETSTTTSSPTTTNPTTSTTEAPASTTTETTEPAPPTNDLITDGLIASREAYLYAVYNLDAPDAVERLNATHATDSPSLELALENVQTLVDNGWLARPNPDVPDTITIESDVTMIDDTTAEVIACVVGAGVVYVPGADDGDDVIVNGEIEAALNQITMVLEDGQWKLSEGTNLTTESGTECVVE